MIIVLFVDKIILFLYLFLKDLIDEMDNLYYSIHSAIYTLAGLIGVCTYIICKKIDSINK